MSGPMTMFEMGYRAMSAQMVRMNTAASNLANAGSVAGSADEAYRPMRTVFAEQLDQASGMSSVAVDRVVRSDAMPTRRHDPGHPLADENGDVWESPVDENAEMIEMLEASRQYSNMIEAMSTAKQLMLETMRMK
ncbi:flagellar basal body rod protein FlgC [Alteriqipengyuania lutimaris]|uniref:Flagellar basal-body rod protein FlgC n=2 Tax=Alteriqipengyuania lutimaris TaxID=1538146 RepID=A0A395LJG7_9SPHN|nr:flagellar basal body rod protein FlgC [Alteriqipengyuania lutimaris]MBB3033977.1 flagellar basal-body rod protein FlgC [Alteriqipengyuania lutimaris]RDS77072.1 flagellar basal body rod protein FlgC [Alteriqipengyuania lutimaris]